MSLVRVQSEEPNLEKADAWRLLFCFLPFAQRSPLYRSYLLRPDPVLFAKFCSPIVAHPLSAFCLPASSPYMPVDFSAVTDAKVSFTPAKFPTYCVSIFFAH
jgi:hypothetical protein